MKLNDYLRGPGRGLDPLTIRYLTRLVEPLLVDLDGVWLAGGLFLFTEESARRWGGPWLGNYAAYRLTDHRKSLYWAGQIPMFLTEYGDLQASKKYGEILFVTTAKPFKLYMVGNDDFAYVKFYATAEEAFEDLNLFEACQPLDFDDVGDMGFLPF